MPRGHQITRTGSPHLSSCNGPQAKGRGWLVLNLLETKGWQVALKGTGSFYESLKLQGLLVMNGPSVMGIQPRPKAESEGGQMSLTGPQAWVTLLG